MSMFHVHVHVGQSLMGSGSHQSVERDAPVRDVAVRNESLAPVNSCRPSSAHGPTGGSGGCGGGLGGSGVDGGGYGGGDGDGAITSHTEWRGSLHRLSFHRPLLETCSSTQSSSPELLGSWVFQLVKPSDAPFTHTQLPSLALSLRPIQLRGRYAREQEGWWWRRCRVE
jgi:hypothetical protein